MNEPSSNPAPNFSNREEMYTTLFANMVIQNTNMAIMLLGKAPHPETGEIVQDLETARILIDQLEMLEAKTKGNLNKKEESLLKQALGALRMAFVETVEGGEAPPQPAAPELKPSSPAAPATPAPEPKSSISTAGEGGAAQEESKKKFSKKY